MFFSHSSRTFQTNPPDPSKTTKGRSLVAFCASDIFCLNFKAKRKVWQQTKGRQSAVEVGHIWLSMVILHLAKDSVDDIPKFE